MKKRLLAMVLMITALFTISTSVYVGANPTGSGGTPPILPTATIIELPYPELNE
jgi:hypothetical protein